MKYRRNRRIVFLATEIMKILYLHITLLFTNILIEDID